MSELLKEGVTPTDLQPARRPNVFLKTVREIADNPLGAVCFMLLMTEMGIQDRLIKLRQPSSAPRKDFPY